MRRNEAIKSGRLAGTVTGLMMAVIIGLCGAVENAYAVPILQLSDGVTTKTVSDEGLGDGLLGTAGAVMFSGSVGNFIVNVTTGLSKPLLGSAAFPSLDLSSVNVSSNGGGTLTIMLTDTDFSNSSGSPFLIGSAIGGVTAGTVSYKSYFDASNTAFGTANLLGNLGPYSGAFAGSSLDNMTAIGPYSLTLAGTVTHTGGSFQATSFNATLRVPEPGTVTLLGTALLVAGLFSLWRKRGSALP